MPTTFRPAVPAALGLLCAGLILAPAAGATGTVKVPVPAPGHVAVAAAPAKAAGTLSAPVKLPAGTILAGGITGKGAKRVVLVAAIRPKDAPATGGSISVKVKGKAKPGRATTTAQAFAAAPSAGLAKAVKPACASAPKALGRALRRSGAAGITAADLQALSLVLAGQLCGSKVDQSLLPRLGLLGVPTIASPSGSQVPITTPPTGGSGGTPPPAGSTTPPPSGGGTTPSGGGTPACANGKDDDGDGQVDDVATSTAPFFDPGCSSATDTSEDSEKHAASRCGLGVATLESKTTFMVDFDSISTAGCPKPMVKGVLDLASAVTTCDRAGYDGHNDGACAVANGVATLSGGQGDQWQMAGTSAGDLCGTRAVAIGYTASGEAWEQDVEIYDFAQACGGGGGATQCSNGVDDDFDGQIDLGGVSGTGADPGCTSASDTTEGSELVFPSTGCWPTVVYDPDSDQTIAYIYVQKGGYFDSCPVMTGAYISFKGLQVTACETAQPYWAGTQAGSCTVKDGDAILAGGSGDRIFVALKLNGPISCGGGSTARTESQIDINDGSDLREAVMGIGYFNSETTYALC